MEPTFESLETFATDEFLRWVEGCERTGDPHRYELLHGRIVMTPPAAWPHGEIGANLVGIFRGFVKTRALGRVLDSSQGYRLPSGDIVEPDVAFISSERWEKGSPTEGGFLAIVPDLLVEILSPSTASRDRGEKRGLYERFGVREYWLVDPLLRKVTVLVAEEGRFRERVVEGDGAVTSTVLAGLDTPLREIFPSS